MEFIAHNLAPIMFAGLICFLLVGFPVAFSLGACGLFFAFIGIELNVLPEALLQAVPLRIFGIMQNDTLLAIPFFTLMGLILERSGMAEDLLDTIGQLFGPIRGGLALAVIFVGALLAATTGVVAASVISMGLISLPIMLRYGYDRRLAAGVIAASGTLAQIIPPSLVLIIIADQMGRSVGDMYKGAFLPGLMLTGFYAGYVILLAIFKPQWVPAIPPEARTLRDENGKSGVTSLLVLTGICVAASMYVAKNMAALHTWWSGEAVERVALDEPIVVALCFGVAIIRGRLSFSLLKQAVTTTTKLSCFVVFILVGATMFGLTFQGVDGPLWVEHLLTGLPGGQLGFLIVVNIMVFFLAFFLDFFELSFIVVPLLAPVAHKLGIDLIWFGVLLAVNMQTSFMHPPFGFALFYLRSVAPAKEYLDKVTKKMIAPVTTPQIYWGAIPFLVIQLMMVGLIIAFPGIVSSGLDKAEVYDLDKVRMEMEATMPDAAGAPEATDPTAGMEGASSAPGDAAAPAADDPLKALQDSMANEKK